MAPFDTNTDFSGQLDALMAPYQGMAQRLNSPYGIIGQNSWIARQHPLVAGAMDNAMLAAAMTPSPQGPEGAGGGISRAFQGLLGAQQFHRQRMLESMMLPYQMAMPRLQAEREMAQTGALESEVPYREAMEQRALSQSDWYARHMQPSPPLHILEDTNTKQPWGAYLDPTTQQTVLKNLITGQFADPKNPPSLGEPGRSSADKSAFTGSYPAQAATAAGMQAGGPGASSDRSTWTKAQWDAATKVYTGITGNIAGARAAGSDIGHESEKENQAFLAAQQQAAIKGLPIEPSSSEQQQHVRDMWNKIFTGDKSIPVDSAGRPIIKSLEERHAEWAKNKAILENQFGHYVQSGAWRSGVSFDPSVYGDQSLLPAQSAPSASSPNPNWKPK